MKNSKRIAAGLGILALAGCAFVPPPSHKPQVSVVNDRYIIVSPEPLVFSVYKDKGPIDIEWQLPADSKFTFPGKDGITVDSRQTKKNAPLERVSKDQFDCELKENVGGKTFRCRNFKVPGLYRYTIRVNDGDNKPLKPLDPMIANEP
jgi:hypothetical protein